MIFTEEKNLCVAAHPRGELWMQLNCATFLFVGGSRDLSVVNEMPGGQKAEGRLMAVLTSTHENHLVLFFSFKKPTPITAVCVSSFLQNKPLFQGVWAPDS